jgi:Na+/melibiose symporter-like transporter
MFLFPTFFLIIGIIAILRFPIDKEKYESLAQEAKKLHEVKKQKVIQGA